MTYAIIFAVATFIFSIVKSIASGTKDAYNDVFDKK